MYLPGLFGANRWALSQRTHTLPGGFFEGELVGTFKKYPPWTRWVKWGWIVSEPTMNSQCTPWVSDPLPPVKAISCKSYNQHGVCPPKPWKTVSWASSSRAPCLITPFRLSWTISSTPGGPMFKNGPLAHCVISSVSHHTTSWGCTCSMS